MAFNPRFSMEHKLANLLISLAVSFVPIRSDALADHYENLAISKPAISGRGSIHSDSLVMLWLITTETLAISKRPFPGVNSACYLLRSLMGRIYALVFPYGEFLCDVNDSYGSR